LSWGVYRFDPLTRKVYITRRDFISGVFRVDYFTYPGSICASVLLLRMVLVALVLADSARHDRGVGRFPAVSLVLVLGILGALIYLLPPPRTAFSPIPQEPFPDADAPERPYPAPAGARIPSPAGKCPGCRSSIKAGSAECPGCGLKWA
jgi:hypothetical protein